MGSTKIKLLGNSAAGSGGAIYLSDHFTLNILHNSNITFHHNSACHGGAIYCDLTRSTSGGNRLTINTTSTTFDKNTDVALSDAHMDLLQTIEIAIH